MPYQSNPNANVFCRAECAEDYQERYGEPAYLEAVDDTVQRHLCLICGHPIQPAHTNPRWLLAKNNDAVADYLGFGAVIMERTGKCALICVDAPNVEWMLQRLQSGMQNMSPTIYTSENAARRDLATLNSW